MLRASVLVVLGFLGAASSVRAEEIAYVQNQDVIRDPTDPYRIRIDGYRITVQFVKTGTVTLAYGSTRASGKFIQGKFTGKKYVAYKELRGEAGKSQTFTINARAVPSPGTVTRMYTTFRVLPKDVHVVKDFDP